MRIVRKLVSGTPSQRSLTKVRPTFALFLTVSVAGVGPTKRIRLAGRGDLLQDTFFALKSPREWSPERQ